MSCDKPTFLNPELAASSQPDGMEIRELFGSGNPIIGVDTYRDPSLLGGDRVEAMVNWRQTPGALSARPPLESILGTSGLPGVSFTVLGSHYSQNGYYLAVGWTDTGVPGTSVYRWSGSAWVEITRANDARYGRTRFDSAVLPVEFVVVKEPFPYQAGTSGDETYIVWQNGTERPRIANTNYTFQTDATWREVCVIPVVPAPTQGACSAIPTLSYFQLLSGSLPSIAGTAGKITGAWVNTGGNGYYIEITITPTVAAGDSVTILSGARTPEGITNPNVSKGGTHQFVYQCSDINIWKNLIVGIMVGLSSGVPAYPTAGSFTDYWRIYHPSAPNAAYKTGSASSEGVASSYTQVQFDKNAAFNTAGAEVTIPLSLGAIPNGFGLEWVGPPPLATTVLRIYASGGTTVIDPKFKNVEYGAQFRVTHFCSGPTNGVFGTIKGGSRAESAATACASLRSTLISALGGPDIKGLRLAEQAGFLYDYRVNYSLDFTPSASLPISRTNIYAQFAGSQGFRYVTQGSGGNYSGGAWNLTLAKKTANVTMERPTDRKSPDFGHLGVPIGDVLFWSGKRLVVGNAKYESTDVGTGVLATSESEYPFRFLTAARFDGNAVDPESSMRDNGVGSGEIIQTILPMSTSSIGFDQVFVLTNVAAYTTEIAVSSIATGLRFRSRQGTTFKNSAASYLGAVIYLDKDRVVRIFDGSGQSISKGTLDRTLTAIPSGTNAVGVVADEKYFLVWENPGSAGNSLAVVYDFNLGKWMQDTYPRVWRDAHSHTASGIDQVWIATTLGETARVESPNGTGDLGGSTVPTSLTFGKMLAPIGADLVAGNIIIRADAGNYTITTRRSMPTNFDGTISLAGSGEVWKIDAGANGLGVVGSGPSAKVTITGDLPSRHKVTQLSVEIGVINGGPTR
jgi:hypothetical protein